MAVLGMSMGARRISSASVLLGLAYSPLSAAQLKIPKNLDDKVANAVKGIAAETKNAAKALKEGAPVKDVLQNISKSQNISEALHATANDNIADAVKAAAGELKKGVDGLQSSVKALNSSSE